MADDQDAEQPKKALVFTEEAKQRQVSHWDMDYLSREELDAIAEQRDQADG